jgi:hypothetical protein
LTVPLLGAFLLSCAIEKPEPLNITEKNPARCVAAEAVFDNFVDNFVETFPGTRVEVLKGDEAEIFLSALNRTPTESDFVADRIIIFSNPRYRTKALSLVHKGCVVIYEPNVDPAIIEMWRAGRVPPLPMSSPHERTIKTKQA